MIAANYAFVNRLLLAELLRLRLRQVYGDFEAAYKSIDRVIETQVAARMVEVVAKMHPVLTFKA